MRDQINQEALFSDETGYYRSPSEPVSYTHLTLPTT